MKLKQAVVATLALIMVVFTATCFAQISEADINIGGIYYGQPMDEIVAKYGDSVKTVQVPPNKLLFVFKVDGTTINITPEAGAAYNASIDVSSGLSTPKGIKVSSMAKDVIDAYGVPDADEIFRKPDGTAVRCLDYYTSTSNNGGVSSCGMLRFHLDRDMVRGISFYRKLINARRW